MTPTRQAALRLLPNYTHKTANLIQDIFFFRASQQWPISSRIHNLVNLPMTRALTELEEIHQEMQQMWDPDHLNAEHDAQQVFLMLLGFYKAVAETRSDKSINHRAQMLSQTLTWHHRNNLIDVFVLEGQDLSLVEARADELRAEHFSKDEEEPWSSALELMRYLGSYVKDTVLSWNWKGSFNTVVWAPDKPFGQRYLLAASDFHGIPKAFFTEYVETDEQAFVQSFLTAWYILDSERRFADGWEANLLQDTLCHFGSIALKVAPFDLRIELLASNTPVDLVETLASAIER